MIPPKPLQRIDFRLATQQIDFTTPSKLGALDEFPAHDERSIDENPDIRGDESFRVPVFMGEDGEAVAENDEKKVGEGEGGGVGGAFGAEGHGAAVEALDLRGAVEAEVGGENGGPGE